MPEPTQAIRFLYLKPRTITVHFNFGFRINLSDAPLQPLPPVECIVELGIVEHFVECLYRCLTADKSYRDYRALCGYSVPMRRRGDQVFIPDSDGGGFRSIKKIL
jgi:hypothetical protein